jgi:outer membrane protein assembly factor BamB
MSWQPIGGAIEAPGALGALRAGDAWIFRAIASVYACAAGDKKPRWETDFGDEAMAIGPMAVVAAGTAAATLVQNEESMECAVVALDQETGKRAWETPLKVRPGAYGLATLDEWVLVHGMDGETKGHLFALDASTGKVRHEVPTATANGVRVAGTRALVPTRSDGVYAVTPGKGEPKRISKVEPLLTAAGDGSLFAYVTDGPAVVELDGTRGTELGRVDAADPAGGRPSRLHELANEGQALLIGKTSARVLDVRGGKVVSTLQLAKGMRAIAAAGTPHGIVIGYRGTSVRETGVAVYDPKTGKQTQKLEVESGLTDGIYFDGGQLVVSIGGSLHFYEWKGK